MSDLSIYLQIIRRWLWLILLTAIVAASLSYAVARLQPIRYQASTTLQVGTYASLLNPDSSMLRTSETLTATYIALLKTFPVLDGAVKALNLPIDADALGRTFTARQITGTSLIRIEVTNTDPVIAADIANELGRQIIANSPTALTKDQQNQYALLQRELDDSETRLNAARGELKVIEASLSSVTASEQVILSARKTELIAEITTTQTNVSSMTSTLTDLSRQGSANSISVVEPARIPENAVGTSPTISALIALMVGAVIGAGIGFVLDYLNNTVRSPSEVNELLGLPVLGAILAFGSKRGYEKKLIAWLQPRSSAAEAYRALRVNLLFRSEAQDGETHLFVITSCGPSEGKSVTTANLATTFALTGMKTLLLDADLRRPAQHKIFNLQNQFGLSDLWANSNEIAVGKSRSTISNGNGNNSNTEPQTSPSLLSKSVQLYINQLTQKTEVPNLEVITSGLIPPNPVELIETPQMREFISQLRSSGLYDIILIDTPPSLVVTDTSVMAKVTNAKAVLIVEAGRTSRPTVVRAVQQLTELHVPLVGVVVNRLNPRNMGTGYGQYYYGYTKYTSAT